MLNQKLLFQLNELGILPGDIVLVHSSLSALGFVEGGAQTVIDTLLSAVGPQGTLLMPAHSKPFSNPEAYIFSLEHTKTHVGIIPETFRNNAGVVRSLHPTHSVSAIGKYADELTKRHAMDRTPVGPNSPYMRLPEYGGKILMLGCGLNPNTFMHGVEEAAHAPYGLDKEETVYSFEVHGTRFTKKYFKHNFTGLKQQYRRLETVLDGKELHRGDLLRGTGYWMKAEVVLRAALHKMHEDPYYFVDKAEAGVTT